MQINTLFESAFYRRLILAHVIKLKGPINQVELSEYLNWSKRTVKTNVDALEGMGIDVEFVGSAKTGGYILNSFGPISAKYVKDNYTLIMEAVSDYANYGSVKND